MFCIKCKKYKSDFNFSDKNKNNCRACNIEKFYKIIDKIKLNTLEGIYLFVYKNKIENKCDYTLYKVA